ncbi:MAG: hypothetical protein Q9218_003192, partial [Villophora microphyllina]
MGKPDQKRMTRAHSGLLKAEPAAPNSLNGNVPCSRAPAKKSKPRLTKKPFPFISVPTEIRIKIYHDSLIYDHILVRKPKARAASLLLSNRQVYSEAFDIFYDVNVFQVYISGLPSETETAMANVHYMRQCCLQIEIFPHPKNTFKATKVTKAKKEDKDKVAKKKKKVQEGFKDVIFRRFLDKFLADIWAGKIECLLIDVWEHEDRYCFPSILEKFTWMRRVHLVQVVVNQVKKTGQVKQYQNYWCQRLERSMMAASGAEYVFKHHG